MVRIVEHNDWVIITLLLCGFAYALMFIFLLRDIRLKDFFLQEYADSSNNLLSWIVTSVVFVALLSTLVSQYIPLVPKFLSDIHPFGYEINKFGFTFLCISAFYFFRTLFSYLFYASVGNSRKWNLFYFTATKFYFGLTLLLSPLVFIHYYFDIDHSKALHIYALIYIIIYVFKIVFYFFHKNQILPVRWYYKFLYICTLQIAPLFALWRLLFF